MKGVEITSHVNIEFNQKIACVAVACLEDMD